ncbi:hypothetical protein ACFOD4_08460 [Pseudoroseomonas globiformis]|uniref:Uncharacterized protein n=1 Tax=Teichococcus globiformis TaxID=2307229 RepID=A0ABV7FXG0_9PROT
MSEAEANGKVVHLPRRRARPAVDAAVQEVELRIVAHFREQNDLLRQMNANLSAQVQRLTSGIERLLGEVSDVRTGRKEEAFAKVGPADASPDLPTVGAVDAALLYTMTSAKIGVALDFNATEIGHLLGPKGLKWSGDSTYQEVGRWEAGHMKYWHHDVPERLKRILTDKTPEELGITSKVAISMFARWKARIEKAAPAAEKLAS